MPKSCDAKVDGNTKESRKKIQVKSMNDIALSCFTMAFRKEEIMRLVSKSKTKEMPDRLAYLLVRKLSKKYKPRDILSHVKMRQRLNQVQMKRGSDPAILFETLAAIKD
jgi:spore maturation protein CgeB